MKHKAVSKNAAKNLKRHASKSGNDESEQDNSDSLGPKAHLKGKKRWCTEDEKEIVDEEEEPPMEEVEDVNGK